VYIVAEKLVVNPSQLPSCTAGL